MIFSYMEFAGHSSLQKHGFPTSGSVRRLNGNAVSGFQDG